MKTFNELKIGDTLYRINTRGALINSTDQYGNVNRADIIGEIMVNDLRKERDDSLGINYNSYNSKFELFLSKESRNLSQVTSKDGYLYFSDVEESNQVLRKIALDQINKSYQEIKDYKESKEKYVRGIREAYYELLNTPPHNTTEQ